MGNPSSLFGLDFGDDFGSFGKDFAASFDFGGDFGANFGNFSDFFGHSVTTEFEDDSCAFSADDRSRLQRQQRRHQQQNIYSSLRV